MGQHTPSTGRTSTFRSLRHPNYRLYFFGQLVSITGFWMQMTALRWVAYDLTSESRWVALVAAAQNLPLVFLAGFGGALADRVSRWSLILVTQSAFLTLTLLLTGCIAGGLATPVLLLLFALATGIIHAVDLPARLSFVKDMVGREDLMNAVALNSFQFNIARILGPWLAGLVLAAVGPWPCFLANALSYGAVLVGFCLMHVPAVEASPSSATASRSVLGGLRYLASQPALAMLILLAAAVSFFGWPFLELMPALARKYLGEQELGYSRMLSATGIGALSAAFTVATFGSPRLRRPFLAVGVVAVVLGLAGLSQSHVLWAGALGSGILGFGLILFMITAQSIVQLEVSDEQRGRVLGVWAMVWSGAAPVANLIAGPLADAWGEPAVLLGQGVGLTLAGLGLGIGWHLWRRPSG